MTGWRVGWMIGPNDVIKGATNLQSHSTSNVANVSQRAALAAVSGPLDDVAMMRQAFDRRRQTIWKMLDAIDGVRSEEHTSELQSLMRISYAGFCLKKQTKK